MSAPFPDMNTQGHVSQLQPSSLLQLPQDILVAVCQHLLEAQDLLRLEQCSKGCRLLVNRALLWNSALDVRFGEEAYNDQVSTESSLLVLKKRYVYLSRVLIPGPDLQAVHLGEHYLVHQRLPNSTAGVVLCLRQVCWLDVHANFKGVLPGEYQVIWRMMKTVPGNVGHQQSPVQCSADAQLVHQGNTAAEATNNSSLHSMQHFNSLPTGQWVDIPGGDVLVEACAHIHVRMWSHSSEWKTGLIWDNVKLQDVNQPASLPAEGSREPDAQSTVQRAPNAFEALLGTVEDRCRLQ